MHIAHNGNITTKTELAKQCISWIKNNFPDNYWPQTKNDFETCEITQIIDQINERLVVDEDHLPKNIAIHLFRNAVGAALGKDLTKSKELADDWRRHINALDAYIKSLQGLPWSKMLSYSACFLLIGTFIWEMGIWRAFPDFLSTAIKLIPTTGMSSTTIQETVAELPKPSVTSTMNAIAKSPVAVFGIVAGVSMGKN